LLRPRLIPCLLLKNGLLIRSQDFRIHQIVGNPMSTVERLSHWNVDELILIDVSEDDNHDLRRSDYYNQLRGNNALNVLDAVAKVCGMPLAFGGRIRTLQDIAQRLDRGADKIIINSQALDDPGFIGEAAKRFGSQCIVVNIDARRHADGRIEVFSHGGRQARGMDAATWARQAEQAGAGEIFLQSIDRDGAGKGYDIDLIRSVTSSVRIPVIACGGVGKYEHVPAGILEGGASAVAAANIFHFFELSYPLMKNTCISAGIPMRQVGLNSKWFPRERRYDTAERDARIADRLEQSRRPLPADLEPPNHIKKLFWCSRCASVSINAAPLEFDAAFVCTGCRTADVKKLTTEAEWERRKGLLYDLLDRGRSKDGSRYDCIIPVSGGKDSYFQTHVIKNELGFNPLLVTYNGNNYTPVGWRNVHRMKEAFGVDHIFFSPSVPLLQKLNRLAFIVMGDMNWHAHVGINTVPVQAAVRYGIPRIIWGEHGLLEMSGQFSYDDFPEMSYRNRLEYFARGFEWTYFVGLDGITERDMMAYKYPSDQELFDLDLRGLHLGNYVKWESNDHTKLVVSKYGFEINDEPFDRTYRRMSNLDDMHENGAHDYLKFIKFGYGRGSDHSCKDVRSGLMTRETAVEMIKKYDHVKPRDLKRWLDYVGMSEDEFDRIADTFRDSRVWRRENGEWAKSNVWD